MTCAVVRYPPETTIMDDKPSWLDLESVIPLRSPSAERDVERITSLSEDTIKRRHSKRVIHLSDRRVGMKLRDALAIAEGK
jgi:hypothetical protein